MQPCFSYKADVAALSQQSLQNNKNICTSQLKHAHWSMLSGENTTIATEQCTNALMPQVCIQASPERRRSVSVCLSDKVVHQ